MSRPAEPNSHGRAVGREVRSVRHHICFGSMAIGGSDVCHSCKLFLAEFGHPLAAQRFPEQLSRHTVVAVCAPSRCRGARRTWKMFPFLGLELSNYVHDLIFARSWRGMGPHMLYFSKPLLRGSKHPVSPPLFFLFPASMRRNNRVIHLRFRMWFRERPNGVCSRSCR